MNICPVLKSTGHFQAGWNVVDYIYYMQNMLPFWDFLSDAEREKLQANVLFREFSKGEIIHNGESDCLGLFLVISGQVRVSLISDNGKGITLYRLLERDICIFTASCMLKNIDFDVFIEAEKKTKALLVPTNIYESLSKSNIAVNEYTKELISSKFSEVMYVLGQILFLSFDKRLAAFLLEQSNIESSDTLSLTHEKIASNLGTAREVVTRKLKSFQAEGIVKLQRGKIIILNKKALYKIENE